MLISIENTPGGEYEIQYFFVIRTDYRGGQAVFF